jgi:hypothetical protein
MITRRTLLSRAAAATAMSVLGLLGSSRRSIAKPAPVDCNNETSGSCDEETGDFRNFIDLSAVLTGIDGNQLAPGSLGKKGVDPAAKAKCEYFQRASKDSNFKQLLNLFSKNEAVDSILRNPNVGDLARSIMLAWYLGAWYEPTDVAKYKGQNPSPIRYRVLSAQAYTQSWIWRIAEAHPMGYSNLRFGYWNSPPDSSIFGIDKFRIAENK